MYTRVVTNKEQKDTTEIRDREIRQVNHNKQITTTVLGDRVLTVRPMGSLADKGEKGFRGANH